MAKKSVKEYAQLFDKANLYLQNMSRTRISSENEEFLHELSETLDQTLDYFGSFGGNDTQTKNLKRSLDSLSRHLANISLSIGKGGDLNPKNDIAGNIKEFKGTFDAFVLAFSKMADKHKMILTPVALEEFIRQLTHFS